MNLLGIRRSGRKAFGLLAIIALLVAEFAGSALAHHPVVSGELVCQAGQQFVTWTVSNSETTSGTNRTMTIDTLSLTLDGAKLQPVGDYLGGFGPGSVFPPQSSEGSTQTGDSVFAGDATGVLKLTVIGDWVGGPQNVSRTAVLTLGGQCLPPPPPPPAPVASISTECDMFGPEMGAISVAVDNVEIEDVTVLIDGSEASLGANPVVAGSHQVVVMAGDTDILNEDSVIVTSCSSPSASAQSVCDPFGDETGAIDISVEGLSEGDEAQISIDGESASQGHNDAEAGEHQVVVTVNGEEVLSQSVAVAACSNPAASVQPTCDPFGAESGSIEVAVSGAASSDVVEVLIDGQPASLGANDADAGDHVVMVKVNGSMLVNSTVNVATCSNPIASATASCEEVLGYVDIAVSGTTANDEIVATIDGQPALVGRNNSSGGNRLVEVTVNGEAVLSESVQVEDCLRIFGAGQSRGDAAAAVLPQTGIAVGALLSWGLGLILSGAGLTRLGARRTRGIRMALAALALAVALMLPAEGERLHS